MPSNSSKLPGTAIEKQIENKDWSAARKGLYLDFFEQLTPAQKQEYEKKRLVQWKKSQLFQQLLSNQLINAMSRFRITGMVIVMMGTVVLHFCFNLVLNHYLINFSIDALIACACLAFLISNLSSKYRLLKSYGILKDYRLMDILSLVLCILVELLVSFTGLDLSIIILIGSYFLQKRRFQFFLEQKYKPSLEERESSKPKK